MDEEEEKEEDLACPGKCLALRPCDCDWDKQKTRQIGRDWNTLIQLNKANKAQISGELFRETLRQPANISEEKQEKQENNKAEIVKTPDCCQILGVMGQVGCGEEDDVTSWKY